MFNIIFKFMSSIVKICTCCALGVYLMIDLESSLGPGLALIECKQLSGEFREENEFNNQCLI